MSQDRAVYPIVFVTGIGQTWTTLKGSERRWNLFAQDKELIWDRLPAVEKLRVINAARRLISFILTGRKVDKTALRRAAETLFRYNRVDDDGRLPPEVEVRIYGARSFEELSHIDLYTGEYTEDSSRTLLDRLLRDVPCESFMKRYGPENMFCFNYSPFTDLYEAADSLHDTLRRITEKTGAPRVALVPMSMGAAVTVAYLDSYYTAEGPVDENFVERVVSVVGAWDGSEGFADVVGGKVSRDWDKLFYEGFLPQKGLPGPILKMLTRSPERTNAALRELLDAMLNGILLRTSAFLALIPSRRWEEMYDYLFSPQRFEQDSRLSKVKAQADRFIAAQKDLRRHMRDIYRTCGIKFCFVGGTGLRPGDESRDFAFMRYLDCAQRDDTDGVLQLSSAMPFDIEDPPEYVGGFSIYDKQRHEIGNNREAIKRVFELAVGEGECR